MAIKTKTDEIAATVGERFKEKYPVSYERIVESDTCFVSWVVEEVMKELKKDGQ